MITVELTSFAASQAGIRSVRDQVFVQEQGIPAELEWDAADRTCAHALARDAEGRAIATGRLLPDGRIGRMAVVPEWRGRGVGARALQALLDAAVERGMELVYLHAQIQVRGFYERAGFVADGAEFMEDGIRHVNMTRALVPDSIAGD